MPPRWPLIVEMAGAMFKAEHPNAEWSPGRASPVWFARAEASLPIVLEAAAKVAEGAYYDGPYKVAGREIATAIRGIGEERERG